MEARSITWLAEDFPVFWSEAVGGNVVDADGNVYVDLTAAFGVCVAGHRHPKIVEAIGRGSRELVHGMGDVHPPAVKVKLLERLSTLAPWPESRGVLANAGSEAVEIALKTTRLATGRAGVVAFEGGYHGMTRGALSVTSRADFRTPFLDGSESPVAFVPFPERDPGSVQKSLEALANALSGGGEAGEPPGAVIVEPIQGRGGVRLPPPGFLAELVLRTRAAGALLILDEIFTGMGRTGSVFALEAEGVVPDLLCLGKALGGGLPLSCCLGPPEVMDAWPASRGEALHTSTFLGHPLACEASLALIQVIEEEGLVGRARTEGRRFLGLLKDALADLPQVVEVRGRGMFLGIELAAGVGSAARLAAALLREGVIVLPAGPDGDVVELTPPLTLSRGRLDASVETLSRAIAEIEL